MGSKRPSFTRRCHLTGLTLSLWKESPYFCLRPASEGSDVNPSKQPVHPAGASASERHCTLPPTFSPECLCRVLPPPPKCSPAA